MVKNVFQDRHWEKRGHLVAVPLKTIFYVSFSNIVHKMACFFNLDGFIVIPYQW